MAGEPGGYVIVTGPIPSAGYSLDGTIWTPSRSRDLASGVVSDAAFYRGRALLVGMEPFVPEGSEFNAAAWRVWGHVGRDVWTLVGPSTGLIDQLGMIYKVAASRNRIVVYGETDAPEWSVFTFIGSQ